MKQNSTPILDFSSLKNAAATLEEAILEFAKDNKNLFVRDACIQRFEYTYELSTKLLRRYLELTEANPAEISAMSFPDLIRLSSKRQLLLHDWELWSVYRNARNATSHTYSEKKAKQVMAALPGFFEEITYFLQKLTAYLNKP